jgi:hypothetical protein
LTWFEQHGFQFYPITGYTPGYTLNQYLTYKGHGAACYNEFLYMQDLIHFDDFLKINSLLRKIFTKEVFQCNDGTCPITD